MVGVGWILAIIIGGVVFHTVKQNLGSKPALTPID